MKTNESKPNAFQARMYSNIRFSGMKYDNTPVDLQLTKIHMHIALSVSAIAK